MMKYLRKAPTLIVIGVTGYVGWPILFAERDSGPPKAKAKAAVAAKPMASAGAPSLRDPFQVDRPPGLKTNSNSNPTPTPASAPTPTPTPASGSSANLASSKSSTKKGELPTLSADEDQVLSGMRLGGTYVDDRQNLAVIDRKVYAQGDQLRGADGDLLPYVITEVRKDRAVVRRGRRDFVIAFSDAPRAMGSVPTPPAPMAQPKAIANAINQPAKPRAPGPPGRPPADPGDPKEMVLQLLSGLGGSSPGAGPGGGDSNPGALGAGVNQTSISAGLDALMGKYDNIGRTGDTSTPSNPGGGTPP